MKKHWKLLLIIILTFTFLKTTATIRDSTLRFPKGVYFKWTPFNLALNKVPTFQIGLEFKFHNFYSIQTEIGIGTGSVWEDKSDKSQHGYGYVDLNFQDMDQVHNKYRIEAGKYIGKGSKSYLAFESCYFTTRFKRKNSEYIVNNMRYKYNDAFANRKGLILWAKLGRQIGIGKYFFVDVFAGLGVRVSNTEYSLVNFDNSAPSEIYASSFWNIFDQDKYTGHTYIFPHAGFGAKLGFRIK